MEAGREPRTDADNLYEAYNGTEKAERNLLSLGKRSVFSWEFYAPPGPPLVFTLNLR